MSVTWTDDMDAALLAGRDAEPAVAWRRLLLDRSLIGVTRQVAERRYRFLKGSSPVEVGRNVDGLQWLIDRKRLTGGRWIEAVRYRAMFRDGGGISLKSSSDVGAGGGTPGPGHFDTVMVSATAAQRELFRVRWVVLGGQSDMLTVMDGVCGIGHTLRELTGGNDRRGGELEAVLKVALDLLVGDTARALEALGGASVKENAKAVKRAA